jgi:4-aminobutyrate aminotransferase
MPDGKQWRCFFGNSGTEAIEAAMKLARYTTGRWQFIACHSAFHGRTMGSLSLTSSKPVQRKKFGPLVPGVTHIPFGNADYLENVVFKTSVNPEEVAAIIVEPIQGEGGYIVPPADFLPGLERIARKHGILLVADEVQSGMGRTGKWFAFEHFDFHPDIVTLAKGVASGMPLGVMMAHADVMTWDPGAHASTFGGNPVCLAAALETVRLLEERYISNAVKIGDFLRNKLEQAMQASNVITEVRGRGLMIGVQVKTPTLRDRIIMECFRRGVLVLGAGASTIRLSPPLIVDEEQAEFAVQTLTTVVAAVA